MHANRSFTRQQQKRIESCPKQIGSDGFPLMTKPGQEMRENIRKNGHPKKLK